LLHSGIYQEPNGIGAFQHQCRANTIQHERQKCSQINADTEHHYSTTDKGNRRRRIKVTRGIPVNCEARSMEAPDRVMTAVT
jgi:hypothetical protein